MIENEKKLKKECPRELPGMSFFCAPAGFLSSLFLVLSIVICISWVIGESPLCVSGVCLKVGVFIIVGGLFPAVSAVREIYELLAPTLLPFDLARR